MAKTKYPLKDLLTVRQFREDKAAQELAKQRDRVAAAEQKLAKSRQRLQDYIEERIRREQELYAEIFQQVVQVRDLQQVKANVQILRTRELAYQQAVIDAERHLDEQRELLVQAQQKYREAVKAQQKLTEHRDIWMTQTRKEQEHAEELEQQDIARPQLLLAS